MATLWSRIQGGTLLTQKTAGEEARSSHKRDQVLEPGHPGSPEKETSRIGCRLSSCRPAFEGGGDKTRRNYGVSKQVKAENPGGGVFRFIRRACSRAALSSSPVLVGARVFRLRRGTERDDIYHSSPLCPSNEVLRQAVYEIDVKRPSRRKVNHGDEDIENSDRRVGRA